MCIFHKWEKYSKPIYCPISYTLYQFKKCSKCGAIKKRTISKAYSNLASELIKQEK